MVEVRDLGMARLQRELGKLGGKQIVTGVVGPKAEARHPNAKATVAQIAAWFEFGRKATKLGGPQPPRPFIQRAFKGGNARKMKDALRRGVADLIDGRVNTADAAMGRMAELTTKVVKKSFDTMNGWAEPLAPWTVNAKGHDSIGFDTHTMGDAIGSEVRDR